jgi:toxin ParE1/3/4
MAQIAWSNREIQDLKEIVEYISRDSKAYAQSFALQIREKVDRLGTFPESGPVIPEDRSGSIRQITVGRPAPMGAGRPYPCQIPGFRRTWSHYS